MHLGISNDATSFEVRRCVGRALGTPGNGGRGWGGGGGGAHWTQSGWWAHAGRLSGFQHCLEGCSSRSGLHPHHTLQLLAPIP